MTSRYDIVKSRVAAGIAGVQQAKVSTLRPKFQTPCRPDCSATNRLSVTLTADSTDPITDSQGDDKALQCQSTPAATSRFIGDPDAMVLSHGLGHASTSPELLLWTLRGTGCPLTPTSACKACVAACHTLVCTVQQGLARFGVSLRHSSRL